MGEPSVLLVNPNLMRPPVAPLALDYLSSALRAQGLGCRLLDLALECDPGGAIQREARVRTPTAVGVTVRNTDDCYFASGDFVLERTRQVVSELRQAFGVPIVCGGVGFSINPVEALRFLGADYGVVGEGEGVLPEAVRRLSRGEPPEDLRGIVTRDSSAESARLVPADLSALDLSARDLLDNRRYFVEGGQAGIETKRGCDGTCVYCADPVSKGSQVRMRPPGNVVAEATSLLGQEVTHWHTCDAEFNRPHDHALAICRALVEAGLSQSMRWYAYCSPVPFSAQLCSAMRQAGCVGINFGADAGADERLRKLGRDHRVEDIEAAVAWCRDNRMAVMLDLLLGGPGETPQTVAATIDCMKRLDPDRVGVSLGVRIYPGTPFARWIAGREPVAGRRGIHGDPEHSRNFLRPTFYLSEALGKDPFGLVAEAIGDDRRFFFVAPETDDRDYNYNENSELVEAISGGYRGAYWDILRRVQDGLSPLSCHNRHVDFARSRAVELAQEDALPRPEGEPPA